MVEAEGLLSDEVEQGSVVVGSTEQEVADTLVHERG